MDRAARVAYMRWSGGGHAGGRRCTAETAAARRSRPNLSSRARFGVRTGSTRREERGELTQGLREVAGVTAEAPRRPWRAAQGRRAAMGAMARFVQNKREDEVTYLAAMLRVKRTEAGRQWRRRSTPTIRARAAADLWCGSIRRRGRAVLGHKLELE
jgi:hypothetical protein